MKYLNRILACLFIGLLGTVGLGFKSNTKHQDVKRSTQPTKPNIIYIMADDLGYGNVGFNGQTKIKTPNIDRLAKEGIIFRQHYAGTAVCAPSRAALMTGINTAHAHVRELSAWTASGKPIFFVALN